MLTPKQKLAGFGILVALAMAAACFLQSGCTSYRASRQIGTDDDQYSEFVRLHRIRCPKGPVTATCQNETAALVEYRTAIQVKHAADQFPGNPYLQQRRLDDARSAALKLFVGDL